MVPNLKHNCVSGIIPSVYTNQYTTGQHAPHSQVPRNTGSVGQSHQRTSRHPQASPHFAHFVPQQHQFRKFDSKQVSSINTISGERLFMACYCFSGFPELPTIKVLHLCRNQHLSHVMEHSLSGLINLEELHMSDNIALSHIDPLAMAMIRNHTGGAIWPPVKKVSRIFHYTWG